MRRLLAAAIAVVLACATIVWANLLQNPGFEDGKTGWSSWGGSDNVANDWWGLGPQEGTNLLGHWWQSGTYQDVTLNGQSNYTFSAYVTSAAGDPLWGDANAFVKWEWRDKTTGDDMVGFEETVWVISGTSTGVSYDVAVDAGTWTLITLSGLVAPSSVTATHGRVVIGMWTSGSPNGGGAALFDNLSVTSQAIPEPLSAFLMAVGIGGMFVIRRRRG
ncbi:MAG: PEP-CTERM sorting domain-containing protein [Kiritimatiellae bacterium]|nr:PEP-CTERM sorting domain-containing protein [Kiritimatiellia bacterium]